MSSDASFKYKNGFLPLLIISITFSALGIILLIIKIIWFSQTKFIKIRTDILIGTFTFQILVGIIIILCALMYEIADVIAVFIEVALSMALWFYYVYVKECVTYFSYSYLKMNSELKMGLIRDRKHERLMFQFEPPMKEYKACRRFYVTELFVEYTYLLCGRGTQWICCK